MTAENGVRIQAPATDFYIQLRLTASIMRLKALNLPNSTMNEV